jgi:DNA-binding transcriptional LysR family regulator
MRSLNDLTIFMLTAEHGSLTAAAHHLGISPAVASASLKRLEEEIGCVLLIRSTRSLRLSKEGERFLQSARLAVGELENALEEISTGREVIRGHIQISLTSDFGRNQVISWLDQFQDRYPQITLKIDLSDRMADLYRQPIDIAIRYGALQDSALVALPLVQNNYRILCAAPEYLHHYGHPATPHDLIQHNCLCLQLQDQIHNQWSFQKEEQSIHIAVSGDRLATDGDVVRRWAVAGKGIAYKSIIDIIPDLLAGRLIAVCPDWIGDHVPLSFICADRRQLSPSIMLLKEFLQQQCEQVMKSYSVTGVAL